MRRFRTRGKPHPRVFAFGLIWFKMNPPTQLPVRPYSDQTADERSTA